MRREYNEVRDRAVPEVISIAGHTYGPGRGTKLYRLVNNGYFFLRYVFILGENGDYRLVVIHDNRLLTDRHYKSLSHAKSAFARMYNRKSWKKGVKPEWSTFFPLGISWVKDEIEYSFKEDYSQRNNPFEAVQPEIRGKAIKRNQKKRRDLFT